MSRKCWASPFTPCTAGGTRATAQSATGWAVTCGTVERPLRLGWNIGSTNASKRGESISSRAVHKALNREPSQSGPEGILNTPSAPVARFLRPHEDVSGRGGFDEPHSTRLDNPTGSPFSVEREPELSRD